VGDQCYPQPSECTLDGGTVIYGTDCYGICCSFPDIPTTPNCEDACNDPNFPEAICGVFANADEILCNRPPYPNRLLDCYIGERTYDCFCCREPIVIEPRPTIEVLCGQGIDTAIGCIPLGSTNTLIGFFLGWGIGIGGGIAFLLILFAGFQITTSAGNPQQLQAGKELLTAAIAGIMMLIFSVFLLEMIGVRILHLPGMN